MTIDLKRDHPFTPTQLVLTMDTLDDVKQLWAIFNTCGTDIARNGKSHAVISDGTNLQVFTTLNNLLKEHT